MAKFFLREDYQIFFQNFLSIFSKDNIFCYDELSENGIEFFEKATEIGNCYPLKNIGFAYEKGIGVPQNYSNSIEFYIKAADMGNAESFYNLGHMYEGGFGVVKNLPKTI